MKAEHLLSINNTLGEGPVWHPEEQKLYWVDIQSNCFYRYALGDEAPERFDVGQPVGTVVFRESGGLVLALRDGFAFWDEAAQELDFIADPEADKPDARFNDGKVDPQGRFWAGTMAEGSKLYRLDTDLSVHVMETEIACSNGIDWSPDRTVMYYTDTPQGVIWAYDYDDATGAISNRRTVVEKREGEGHPDGLCVDSEGYIWGARWDGWRVNRYAPDGSLDLVVNVPVAKVTSCCFGGSDLDELFITCASVDFSAADWEKQPQAGDIFRVKTGSKGQLANKFKG